MWAICIRECVDLFKGFKAILIISILIGMSFLSTKLGSAFPGQVSGISQKEMYTSALILTFTLFGILFVFALSHGVINREMETRTIRFLVTKTSRQNILLGKFLGVLLFWCLIVGACFSIITFTSKTVHLSTYLETMTFLFYAISAVTLLSILIPKSSQSMFIGIVLALSIPGFSLWAYFSEQWYISWFKYLTPYYYSELTFPFNGTPLLIGAIFITIALYLFQRRDL